MAGGKLVPISPLGKGIRDGAVDIADYEGQAWPKVPVAIPSKSRESELCEQTLKMLRSYEYDMSKVHVFVDATHVRKDGSNEYDAYFKYLRDHGFAEVNVHPGGVGLRKQYERIFAFFKGEPEIILTSDMVPRIDWRRRKGNVCVEPLPKERLFSVIRIGFDICRIQGARAWSLSSCKAGLNLPPGHISRKCGLLCGNFCGGPKLSKSLETLTAANPILEEIGVAGFGGSSASAASSSSSRFNAKAAAKKKGPVVLPPRARLLRAPTGLQNTEDSQVDEDEQ